MPGATIYLRTQQVADALGIGVSTLKRWVDAGEIRALRTVGKHRLIEIGEAIRFARARSMETSALERLAGTGSRTGSRVDEEIRSRLVAALREGEAAEARRMIADAHAVLGSGAALADALIRPTMRAIGHGWRVGGWDIYQEHLATQIVATALADLIARVEPSEVPGPVALGASPEGDPYTLPGLVCELTLRELGWDVKNLGPNLPLSSLARAIEARRPRLVYLSACHLVDPIRFLDGQREVCRAARASGGAVVMGGRGIHAGLVPQLDCDAFGRSMADLAGFGRRFAAEAPPPQQTPGATDRPGLRDQTTPTTEKGGASDADPEA